MSTAFVIFAVASVIILAPYAGCHLLTSRPPGEQVTPSPQSAPRAEPVTAQEPERRGDSGSPEGEEAQASSGLSEIEQLLSK